MNQCKYCGVQIETEYCDDCACELNLVVNPINIDNIPDKIEPIVGYRGWNIDIDLLTPCVSNKNNFWVPYEKYVAECIPQNSMYHFWNDITPVQNCTCGIYAFKEFSHLITRQPIFGEVYLWGKIVPHKEGYRAQYAYPRRLYVPLSDTNSQIIQIEEIAQTYGIKVIKFNEVVEYTSYDNFEEYSKFKKPVLVEESKVITYIKYLNKEKCKDCGSHEKCFVDEKSGVPYYFYCFSCYSKRKNQNHLLVYQNAFNRTHNQSIPEGLFPKGY